MIYHGNGEVHICRVVAKKTHTQSVSKCVNRGIVTIQSLENLYNRLIYMIYMSESSVSTYILVSLANTVMVIQTAVTFSICTSIE